MAQFPKSYGRRRMEELTAKRALGSIDLPSKLFGCDEILADAADDEVTYFNRFVVFRQEPPRKTSTTGGGYATLPGWAAVARDKRAQIAIDSRFQAIGRTMKPLPIDTTSQPGRGNAGGKRPVGGRQPARGALATIDRKWANPIGTKFTVRGSVLTGQPLRRLQSKPVMFMAKPGGPAFAIDLHAQIDAIIAAASNYFATVADFDLKKAIWAVGLEFEQVWHSEGYRRGRLVRSIPLAPGEQLEIQTKSWDRRTIKKTMVESIEQNLSTEITGEEKWTLAAKMNFSNQTNASVTPTAGANGGVTIPIEEMPIKLGGNLGISGNLSDAMTHAMDSTNEFVQSAMMKSAQSLKAVRTNSVETGQEIGTETATKQIIANTNRCHSVAYHYFEVTEDFTVTTQPIDANLYLLVPMPVPEITAEWLLCHECELRRVMYCPDYYPGFAAAKRLLMQAIMAPVLAALPPAPGTPGAGGGTASDGGTDPLDAAVKAALTAYMVLRDATILPSSPPNPQGLIDAIGGWLNEGGKAIGEFGGKVVDAVEQGVEKVGEVIEDTGEKVSEGLAAVGGAIGGALEDAGNFLGFAQMSTSNSGEQRGAMQFSTAGNTAGGPGSYVYWGLAGIVAPEIAEAFEYLEAAWPAARNAPAERRMLAEITVLQEFFGRLGDPKLTFGKVNAAVAILAGGAVAAGGVAGGVAGGIAGAIIGGVVASEIPGVTTWVGVAIGGAAGAGIGAVLGAGAVAGVLGFVASIELLGIADTIPDDEGLGDKVSSLWAQYNALRSTAPITGQMSLQPGTGADGGGAASAAYERALGELRELAEAKVEFDRLVCHIRDHFAFYLQALWAGWTGDQIAAVLEQLGVPPGVVENRFSGFVGIRAAVKVTDLDWVKDEGGLDWQAMVDKAVRDSAGAAESELITLPTQGMVVEPALGQCCACEDFVQEHRKLDLDYRAAEVRLAQAKADQAEQEVARFKKRVDAGELGDPTPFEGASVTVSTAGDGG